MKQFAVIGLGRFGSSVALSLVKLGHEVLAIDRSEEKVNELSDEVTYAVQADALDKNTLKSLGIRNFDVVIVAIGEDIQASILVTVILKEMGVRKVVAKARTELHGKVLAKVGADLVVFPERDMGERLAYTLASGNVLDQLSLSPHYSVMEIKTPESFIGHTLEELAVRRKYGVTVVAIRRGEDIVVSPSGQERIVAGDILVVLGRNERLHRIMREE